MVDVDTEVCGWCGEGAEEGSPGHTLCRAALLVLEDAAAPLELVVEGAWDPRDEANGHVKH